jgi:hypothetical protein
MNFKACTHFLSAPISVFGIIVALQELSVALTFQAPKTAF